MNVSKIMELRSGEAVLRVVRHYGLTFLPKGVFAFILFAVPFFFLLPILSWGRIGDGVLVALLLFALWYSLRVLNEWYWNAFIITTKRVVDVDQHGFFRRTVSEAPYEKIQDVSHAIKGIWATMFGYGTVVVQTAGTNVNLELPSVKDPKSVHHLITETASASHARRGGAGDEKVAHLLDAAAGLSDAEARAFLVAIQEAVNTSSAPDVSVRPLDEVEDLMADGPDGQGS